MTIRELRCVRVSGRVAVEAFEERQLQMLDVYPELARRGPAPGADRVTETYVEVVADDGTTGLFGPIFDETAPIILTKLASHVVGQDPLAFERIWDVLYRQDRHARKGYEMLAISAVDCALWDLRGKLLGQPVYRLLGGPTRERVDCYASMLGHSIHAALNVIAAQSPAVCPMAEFLLRPQVAKQALHTRQVWPANGSIALPDTAGLGIELDAERIDARTPIG